MNKSLQIALLLTTWQASAEPAQEKNQVVPMLAQVPTFDEHTLSAKLLANAVNKEETLNNQHNVLTLRQLEAQNKHTSQVLEQEKLALERNKLALEQLRLTQQQQTLAQQTQHSEKYGEKYNEKMLGAKQRFSHKAQRQSQAVANIRLVSIISLPSGVLKAIFYQDNKRFTYLQGDQMFMGAQLLKVAANGVAIKLNEEVIFKYLN